MKTQDPKENFADNHVIRQSQYFETFWWLSKLSFHHKWNEAQLLVKSWYVPVASQVAEQLNT